MEIQCNIIICLNVCILFQVFSRYGKLVSVRLVRDIVTGLSKKYAFIEYETSKITLNAYSRCKSLIINDFEVFVDFECERLLPGWKPRRLGIIGICVEQMNNFIGFKRISL